MNEKLYRKTIVEFLNIVDFCNEYYDENSIIVPLCGAPIEVIGAEEISNVPDNELTEDIDEELYRKMYDYRLMNPYLLRNRDLMVLNVKMLGDKCHGLIMRICDILEWVDKLIEKIPFGLDEKIVESFQKKYDSKLGNGKGGFFKTIVWVPLWNICNGNAIVITLFNRVDIVLT